MMSDSPPLVTAVIPTRNRPGLVHQAVLSALNQTFTNLEVVVVVDGPDLETINVLEQIRDQRLRIVPLAESVGGSEARNIGVREASGEWIALLDDDDEWLPNKIAAQVNAVRDRGSLRILATSMYLHRSPGKIDAVRPRRLPREGEEIQDFMFDFLCYFQTSTFLCSRTLSLEVPFQKGLPSFHDIDWFLRVASQPEAHIVVVPEPLSIYNAPDDRITITSRSGWRERLEWGKRNRALMSRRAYSRFIVGSCVGRAVQDKCGYRGFFELLRECLVVGSPTVSTLALFVGSFAVTPAFRRRIRDSLFLPSYKAAAPESGNPVDRASDRLSPQLHSNAIVRTRRR